MLAFAGGILGVLMMVPLRRALIVKEHGVLPYPEGTACADVLVAGERGGELAKTGLRGPRHRRALEVAVVDLQPVPAPRSATRTARTRRLPERHAQRATSRRSTWASATSSGRASPACMFAGGVLSWLVLLPLLSILGADMTAPFPPISPASATPGSASRLPRPSWIWSAYIRYIGAGAVLAAGLITLARRCRRSSRRSARA